MLRIVDPQALRAGTRNWSRMITRWIQVENRLRCQWDQLLYPHDPTVGILKRYASISYDLPLHLHDFGDGTVKTRSQETSEQGADKHLHEMTPPIAGTFTRNRNSCRWLSSVES